MGTGMVERPLLIGVVGFAAGLCLVCMALRGAYDTQPEQREQLQRPAAAISTGLGGRRRRRSDERERSTARRAVPRSEGPRLSARLRRAGEGRPTGEGGRRRGRRRGRGSGAHRHDLSAKPMSDTEPGTSRPLGSWDTSATTPWKSGRFDRRRASQSAADAARDGVVLSVAELSIADGWVLSCGRPGGGAVAGSLCRSAAAAETGVMAALPRPEYAEV